MKPRWIVLGCVLVFSGCNPWPESVLGRNGLESFELAREFSEIVPPALHGVRRLEGIGGPLSWKSVGGLHGRYMVRMYFPVSVDVLTGRIGKAGDARFSIYEVSSVDVDDSGMERTSFTANQRWFGEKEWALVVAANGDWTAIGFPIVENAPAPGFDRAIRISQ